MAKFRRKHRQLNRSRLGNFGIYFILTILGIFMILPMVYTVSSSLKPLDELWVFPPRFFVQNPTTDNFKDLFRVLNTSHCPLLQIRHQPVQNCLHQLKAESTAQFLPHSFRFCPFIHHLSFYLVVCSVFASACFNSRAKTKEWT